MKLDHVGVVVKDTDISLDFYRKALGAKIVDSYADEGLKLTFLEVGGQIIELVEHVGRDYIVRDRGPVDHIAFRVDNLDQALEKVRSMGARLLFPESKRVGNKMIMFFTGPDGESLEFVQLIDG